LQENLIKEDKAANSNSAALAAQSSPPEDDDDEAQTDGPSQDGAPGDNSVLHFLFAKFLI
jgi:methionyl aminopeptidase